MVAPVSQQVDTLWTPMHDPRTIIEHTPRQGRSPSQAATLMLALFVFAAIPAVSIAQGLDAAVLAELMRDDGRRLPPKEPDSNSKGLKAAVSLARRLGSTNAQRIARPRVVMARRVGERPAQIATREPRPAAHDLEESLLSLPPPVR